ncbi:MAG: hypothetical protein JWR22_152 [Herminiimonas sp.]|nr:hypothetical protein [Herminiimonas sp.]
MLKYVFCALLIANGLLFAWHQGFLDGIVASGHEPGRLRAQFNADKIQLVSQPVAVAAGSGGGMFGAEGPKPGAPGAVPTTAPANVPATTGGRSAAPLTSGTSTAGAASQPGASMMLPSATQVAAASACIDVGSFNPVQARRFEAQMASVMPDVRLARREAQETSSHMVLIPSQGSKEGADRKVAELRRLGLSDLYVIQDNSALRWAISLGIFKSEEAARAHLAALGQRGVQSARLIEHHADVLKVAYQLRGVDAATKTRLERIKPRYPGQEWRNCS